MSPEANAFLAARPVATPCVPTLAALRKFKGLYLYWKVIASAMNRANGNCCVPMTGIKGRLSTSLTNLLAIVPSAGIIAKVASSASSVAFFSTCIGIGLLLAMYSYISKSSFFICWLTLSVKTPERITWSCAMFKPFIHLVTRLRSWSPVSCMVLNSVLDRRELFFNIISANSLFCLGITTCPSVLKASSPICARPDLKPCTEELPFTTEDTVLAV